MVGGVGGGLGGGLGGTVIPPGRLFGPTVPGTVLRGGGLRPFDERFAPFVARDDGPDDDATGR